MHGTYKIFFEPLISAQVNGNAMFLTLRDAIKYDESQIDGEILKESKTGVYIAQAGDNNYEYQRIEKCFGTDKLPEVKYYRHK